MTIAPAVDAEVFFRMNAAKYKIWFEGYADLGREEDNLREELTSANIFRTGTRVFAEVSLELEDMDWEFAPVIAHKSGKTTFAYLRRLSDLENNYRLEYDLSAKWRLRAEHFFRFRPQRVRTALPHTRVLKRRVCLFNRQALSAVSRQFVAQVERLTTC